MILFLDTNVVLEVLARREPWVEHSAGVLALINEGKARGLVAAHTITTLDYLLVKHRGRATAATALIDLLEMVQVAPVDHDVILSALSLGWPDFEDAVQAVCALNSNADYLVTRDPEGVDGLSIPVVNPAELLAFLANSKEF